MTTYVMRDGKLVEKSQAAPLEQSYVVSDLTEVFESPVDGKTLIHSRGQYERHLRAHGKHISEPGDVKARQTSTPRSVEDSMRTALRDLGVTGL